jgi:class 3 adenylate cyclase/tetratricopeptide (TPR) repeat protein
MTCGRCGAENRAGRKFCADCGSPLSIACPACGTANEQGERFCGECGSPLTAAAAAPAPAPTADGPAAERRHVSVLFADLVGFTAASEERDAEDTRELLSAYFDTCRRLIDRYGGTVEKFIGDAVMAVWGTPTANEDDAERAVRAALDLVAAVPELDSALAARAGVLTGEAAVTLGAEGQGMVAGDLVNTAARIQGAADPGTVLVGETTRRASEAAIAYEDAGAHELRGKTEPVPLFRALRVTAARAGALKTGLEPPFVGRERERRLVKELFHASAEEQKAHLVSVVGIAGIGKSRLAWEFEKYIDGLIDDVWWHRGRCLAYGEGVAYWALAEMVRMRARIGEEEPSDEALAKLRATLDTQVADPEERAWLEPRLAHLLGLGEPIAADRQELFSAWRVFFERLADQGPCVLVFEDLQWAEPGLLDFIDHVLEWSRSRPVFVLALQRPEGGGQREGRAARNATTLSLEPLSEQAMESLLDGFVPGLPVELRAEILGRAEGVPLYAVETVRMLLDRGLLAREGDVYRPTQSIEALAVPETLHALLAARLDGLDVSERALVQDASVLGKTFTKQGLASLSGRSDEEIEALLTSLVRKEVFSLQADPRSPERGQFGFLQDLLKRVAYETLSKKERKARHLAAATHLTKAWGDEQEIVEVVASHYLDAYRLLPEADDAAEIKRKAREALARAGERAASLAATVEAARVFAAAAQLADEPVAEAALRALAGRAALTGGAFTDARRELERAHELYEQNGAGRDAALTLAFLGRTDFALHDSDRAVERLERAFSVLAAGEQDEGLAAVAAELARLGYFRGELELAEERVLLAIDIAQRLWLPETLSHALNTAGLIAGEKGRVEYGFALLERALRLALDNDLPPAALRAYNNVGNVLDELDRYEEMIDLHERSLALARKVGARSHEWGLAAEYAFALLRTGQWDECADVLAALPEEALPVGAATGVAAELAVRRGRLADARALLAAEERTVDLSVAQARAGYRMIEAQVLNAEGEHTRALAAATEALDTLGLIRISAHTKSSFVEALTAAHALADAEAVRGLLARIEAIPRGMLPPTLAAHSLRFRALLGEEPDQRFRSASAMLREYRLVPEAALVQLDHAEWLLSQGRAAEAEPLRAEAREVFSRIGAAPWLERADALDPGLAAVAAEAN